MEKQQTAVDWLHETFAKATKTELKDNVNLFFKEAKKMEKEQIINAWIADDNPLQRLKAEQYYNETFKNNNHANS